MRGAAIGSDELHRVWGLGFGVAVWLPSVVILVLMMRKRSEHLHDVGRRNVASAHFGMGTDAQRRFHSGMAQSAQGLAFKNTFTPASLVVAMSRRPSRFKSPTPKSRIESPT